MNQRRNEVTNESESTSAWLVDHHKYSNWLSQRRGLLCIKGNPGAGKSTLMKYVLQSLQRQQSGDKFVIASFFIYGSGVPLQRTPIGLFRSLLHQILLQVPLLLSEFHSIFEKKRETEGEAGKDWFWHQAELQQFLESVVV